MIVGMFFYHFEQFRPKWATFGDFSTFAQIQQHGPAIKMAKVLLYNQCSSSGGESKCF